MHKFIILFLILTSCSNYEVVSNLSQTNLDNLLGEKIVIEGTAMDGKLGALIDTKDKLSIWINGLNYWPKGYYLGGNTGEKIRVTGILIKKYDLPVYIYNKGDIPKSGIPTPEGTDLKKASQRYLLKRAKWEIISE